MLSPMKSHSLFHISNGPSPNAFLFLFYSFILLHGMYNEFAFLYSFTYHSMVFISRIGVPGLLLNKSYVFFGPYLLFLDFVRFVFQIFLIVIIYSIFTVLSIYFLKIYQNLFYIFDNAASSATRVKSGWSCKIDAGTCGVTGPRNASRTMSAFASPDTIMTTFFA